MRIKLLSVCVLTAASTALSAYSPNNNNQNDVYERYEVQEVQYDNQYYQQPHSEYNNGMQGEHYYDQRRSKMDSKKHKRMKRNDNRKLKYKNNKSSRNQNNNYIQQNNQSEVNGNNDHNSHYDQAINEGRQPNDMEIGEKIVDELKGGWAGDDKHKNIHVKIYEGSVTLSGSVASEEHKREAEQKVKNISGVKEVINQITIQNGQSRSIRGQHSNY